MYNIFFNLYFFHNKIIHFNVIAEVRDGYCRPLWASGRDGQSQGGKRGKRDVSVVEGKGAGGKGDAAPCCQTTLVLGDRNGLLMLPEWPQSGEEYLGSVEWSMYKS